MGYTRPTDEQLARFAVVRVLGYSSDDAVEMALHMFRITPSIRDGWLVQHRLFQEAAWSATGEGE